MSEKEDLIKKMNGSIEWIKKYVEKARANGVVIGSSGGKDSVYSNCYGNKSSWKRKCSNS